MSELFVVTGGAGFIGSHIVKALNKRGHDRIIIVDELEKGDKWKNLRGLHYEDVVQPEPFRHTFVDELLPDEIDAVFHMGACSATTETDADYLLDNNYRYTRDLCEWCLGHGVRFIYASSAATYGDGALGYSDADEKTPLYTPLNMYGYSKHMFDMWALRRGLLKQIAGLKYFNVYGPGEAHKGDMRSVIHKAFGQIRETGKVQLFKSYRPEYDDGGQVRDFVYVNDAVVETLYFYDNPDVSGLFNCGTGKARTWNDLVKAVFAAMERDPNIEYIEMPDHLKDKYQYHTEADMNKVRTTGFDYAFHSLEDGIQDYVREYLMTGK